jgi:hypothetical protein
VPIIMGSTEPIAEDAKRTANYSGVLLQELGDVLGWHCL